LPKDGSTFSFKIVENSLGRALGYPTRARRKEVSVATIIPSFLLKKLYVQGSFKNTQNGFQVALKNALAPGTLIGVGTIQIDGRDIPHEQITITIGDAEAVRASEISLNAPKLFPLNSIVTFLVDDKPLAPGNHSVLIQVSTKEAGDLSITAEDSINEYT
jgi:hypothetical protein